MNVQALLAHEFPVQTQSYGARDCSLYALSAGYGQDPMDERQLQYVYGDAPKTAGGMALVLANPGFWQRQAWTGIDWARCVLGEQHIAMHRPLPAAGRIASRLRVTRITDKGKQFGAMLHSERTLHDADSGTHYATLSMVTICRGDGGFGGPPDDSTRLPAVAARAPDIQTEQPTLPQQALLFDLHGIVNPVHSWPAAAREAGYPRPFLHGVCLMGLVQHAIARELAAYDTDGVTALSARFRGVFYPGETLLLSIWRDGSQVRYEARAKERSTLAIEGSAQLRPAGAEQ